MFGCWNGYLDVRMLEWVSNRKDHAKIQTRTCNVAREPRAPYRVLTLNHLRSKGTGNYGMQANRQKDGV
jgi:hypothetical protein